MKYRFGTDHRARCATCAAVVYKCTKCGNIGCSQKVSSNCHDITIKPSGFCMKCNAVALPLTDSD